MDRSRSWRLGKIWMCVQTSLSAHSHQAGVIAALFWRSCCVAADCYSYIATCMCKILNPSDEIFSNWFKCAWFSRVWWSRLWVGLQCHSVLVISALKCMLVTYQTAEISVHHIHALYILSTLTRVVPVWSWHTQNLSTNNHTDKNQSVLHLRQSRYIIVHTHTK